MALTPLARTLYRALHRSLRQMNLSSGSGVLTLRLPVSPEAWGSGSTSHGSDKHDQEIKRYLGDLAQCAEPAFLKQEPSQTSPAISRCAISELHLKELLREMFRTPASGDAAQYAAAVNKGFRALRILGEQSHLASCSSTTEDQGVRVELTSSFVKAAADAAAGEVLAHLQREWEDFDAAARAVVGKTPILSPGEVFEYVSGAVIETPVGDIQGSFQMAHIDSSGKAAEFFDAEVAPAKLLAPERALETEQSSEEEEDGGGPHILVGVPWDDDHP